MAKAVEPRGRITVIDDHPEFLEVVQEVLSDLYDVAAFSGHEITPEHIVDSRPDLLVIDLRLDAGQLQGWEIVELVRAHRHLRLIPIVVCSADPHALKGRAAAILNAGNTAVLAKPFDLAHLEQVVRHGLTSGFPDSRPVAGDASEYGALFVGSTDAILVADGAGRYLDANDVALDLIGLSREELRRLSIGDLVATEQAWTDAEWGRLQRDGWWHGLVRLSLPEDRTVLMLATAKTMPNGGHPVFVSWLQPVDESGELSASREGAGGMQKAAGRRPGRTPAAAASAQGTG